MNGYLVDLSQDQSFYAADKAFNTFHVACGTTNKLLVLQAKIAIEDVEIPLSTIANLFRVRRAAIVLNKHTLSVVWGTGTYSSNKHDHSFTETPGTVEVMVDGSDDILSYVTPMQFISLWQKLTKEEPNDSVESLTL